VSETTDTTQDIEYVVKDEERSRNTISASSSSVSISSLGFATL